MVHTHTFRKVFLNVKRKKKKTIISYIAVNIILKFTLYLTKVVKIFKTRRDAVLRLLHPCYLYDFRDVSVHSFTTA